jgi:16S rRNA G966 N2-methylase RsmD
LFDIIFADPPYDNIPYRDLKFLARHLKPTGTLVLSWPGKADVYYIPELIEVQIKKYGDAQLIFYKYA